MQPPPCSFSLLEGYETCPFKYFAAKVSRKYPEAQNEASLWGNRVHKALELRIVNRAQSPLPEGMEQWEPLVEIFEDLGGELMAERRYALNRQFNPDNWATSWFRGVIDVAVIKGTYAMAYDWKTGKEKPDTGQLKLSAAALMHTYPFIESVTTGYIWLKTSGLNDATYTRDDLPMIWEELLPRIARWELAYKTDTWEKRPSGLCREWCSNMDCQFNGRRGNGDERVEIDSSSVQR